MAKSNIHEQSDALAVYLRDMLTEPEAVSATDRESMPKLDNEPTLSAKVEIDPDREPSKASETDTDSTINHEIDDVPIISSEPDLEEESELVTALKSESNTESIEETDIDLESIVSPEDNLDDESELVTVSESESITESTEETEIDLESIVSAEDNLDNESELFTASESESNTESTEETEIDLESIVSAEDNLDDESELFTASESETNTESIEETEINLESIVPAEPVINDEIPPPVSSNVVIESDLELPSSGNHQSQLKPDPAYPAPKLTSATLTYFENNNEQNLDEEVSEPDIVEKEHIELETKALDTEPVIVQENISLKLLLCEIGGMKVALNVDELDNIIRWPEHGLNQIPGRRSWEVGIYSDQQHNTNVVDPRTLIEAPEKERPLSASYILLTQDRQLGIACDNIQQIINKNSSEINWRQNISQRSWFIGVVSESMHSVIDIRTLINAIQKS